MTTNILDDHSEMRYIIQSHLPTDFQINITGKESIHIFVENAENNKCFELHINKSVPDSLLIKDLQKCGTDIGIGSGNYLLQKIEQIANNLGIRKIIIDMDASVLYINCNSKKYSFSLRNLYLFAYGNTWYGKNGFNLQYNSDKFLKYVDEFINQPFIDIAKKSFSLFSLFSRNTTPILIREYFIRMISDLRQLTRNKMCINDSDSVVLEKYQNVLKHYTRLFEDNLQFNYDGPYVKYLPEIPNALGRKHIAHKRKSNKRNTNNKRITKKYKK
jgi:hypothetical protein